MPTLTKTPPPTAATPRRGELFDPAFHRQLEQLALVTRRVTRERNRAGHRSIHTGAGFEYADHRDYSAGDDYRRIDWNAYARIGRLLVRLYEQPADVSVHILVDRSASMAFGTPSKLDCAKKLAAALAYVGLSQHDRVGVVAFAAQVQAALRPARGKRNIFGIFEFLQQLSAAGTTDLANAMRGFVSQNKRRGMAIVISDLDDPSGCERAIDTLRHARFELVLLRVLDHAELEPEMRGDVELEDAETGALRDFSMTAALLARYRSARATADERLRSYCAERRVALFTLETAHDPQAALLQLLGRGGIFG
jgi:uncharacterized protein (DUF58 family)